MSADSKHTPGPREIVRSCLEWQDSGACGSAECPDCSTVGPRAVGKMKTEIEYRAARAAIARARGDK